MVEKTLLQLANKDSVRVSQGGHVSFDELSLLSAGARELDHFVAPVLQ